MLFLNAFVPVLAILIASSKSSIIPDAEKRRVSDPNDLQHLNTRDPHFDKSVFDKLWKELLERSPPSRCSVMWKYYLPEIREWEEEVEKKFEGIVLTQTQQLKSPKSTFRKKAHELIRLSKDDCHNAKKFDEIYDSLNDIYPGLENETPALVKKLVLTLKHNWADTSGVKEQIAAIESGSVCLAEKDQEGAWKDQKLKDWISERDKMLEGSRSNVIALRNVIRGTTFENESNAMINCCNSSSCTLKILQKHLAVLVTPVQKVTRLKSKKLAWKLFLLLTETSNDPSVIEKRHMVENESKAAS